MWFKHLQLYRLLDEHDWSMDQLTQALDTYRFAPVTETQARRVGWAAPAGRHGDQLVHEIQGHRLMTLLRQERLLPSAVVKETLDERVETLTAQQGYPPGRRDKLALKERIVEELLPRAFTRTTRTDLWWDTKRRLIGINASSAKRAEEILDVLRESLGSLKVIPLAPQTPAGRTMTTWLTDPTTRPEGVVLGDQIELRAKGDDGILRARSIDPDGEEVRMSLDVGRQASKLALNIEEQMTLVLQEDMSIKSIRFADAVLKEIDDTDSDDNPVMQMETEFALMAHVLGETAERLMQWLGGEATPAPAAP
ncbi:recombination-associated protein RdgC [Kushneria konosiri]|uniref:Recombination-associated protein RdgC n=1 Tax=Kushneria konosiri TaxID=698828 RepID=A0A2Z2HA07_9GAMM|nr:recombination-associated protein RdgC [Kushneria konosiri]ARS54214.1 recombination-associated protein RdgC [Kushneria konosiri]